MKTINVAIVGCGYVAEGHLKAWSRVPNSEVSVVCDLNQDLARKTAEAWKIPTYLNSISEITQLENIDLVDICTPPQVHAQIAVAAMEAGKNVLIEKPMTMSVEDAQKIVDCQKREKVKAGVLHNWLFDKSVLAVRSLLKNGYLGEIMNVDIEALNTKQDSMASNQHHWCHTFPGGRFSEMLAHPIYLSRYFLQGELKTLGADTSKIGDYPWMKSDELCILLGTGKGFARVYASFNSSRDAIYLSLYGKKAIAKLDIINSTVNFFPNKGIKRSEKAFDSIRQALQLTGWTVRNGLDLLTKRWFSGHDMYIRLFAQSLLDNSVPPVPVEEGLEVIKTSCEICEKIELTEKQRQPA
jgi:predicted dehydrogenase